MFCPPMRSDQLAHSEQVDVVMSAVCFGLTVCFSSTVRPLPVHGLRMQLVLYAHVRTFTGSRVDEGPAGHCNRSSRLLIFLVWEVWLLNGSTPDCCPAVPGSNPASPQPTADCQSSGGLPPGMALGFRLTSVRGNRGVNYVNEPLVRQKHYKKKKYSLCFSTKNSIHCAVVNARTLKHLKSESFRIL
jgi:hypothetical protein